MFVPGTPPGHAVKRDGTLVTFTPSLRDARPATADAAHRLRLIEAGVIRPAGEERVLEGPGEEDGE